MKTKEKARQANREACARYRSTLKGKMRYYYHNAINAGREFSLTEKEFESLIEQRCAYCGGDGFGIDRMDNDIGYTKENSVSCCSPCNQMKSNLGFDEFIGRCKKIAHHLK